jgi:hypothetical protein
MSIDGFLQGSPQHILYPLMQSATYVYAATHCMQYAVHSLAAM